MRWCVQSVALLSCFLRVTSGISRLTPHTLSRTQHSTARHSQGLRPRTNTQSVRLSINAATRGPHWRWRRADRSRAQPTGVCLRGVDGQQSAMHNCTPEGWCCLHIVRVVVVHLDLVRTLAKCLRNDSDGSSKHSGCPVSRCAWQTLLCRACLHCASLPLPLCPVPCAAVP